MWREGIFDSSGWFFHHQGAYFGNKGNAEESIYSQYILTFCRRKAVDDYHSGRSRSMPTAIR